MTHTYDHTKVTVQLFLQYHMAFPGVNIIKKKEKKSRLYLPYNMLKKFYSEHIIIKNSNKIEGRNWVNGNVHNF